MIRCTISTHFFGVRQTFVCLWETGVIEDYLIYIKIKFEFNLRHSTRRLLMEVKIFVETDKFIIKNK